MSDYQHKKIFIQGPVGVLQSLYHPGKPDRPAVVICHPHPVFGGTMRNKVVYWMARAFEDAGCSVLRFNFRGVEQSEGEWDEGRGEADDARAALDWMDETHPESRLWLAGFSFGCYAGLQAARTDDRVAHMFAVAPAVNLWPFSFMIGENRPITVISGMADEIVPFEKVERSVKGKRNIQFHPIEGAGHFFPKHMDQMTELLLADVRSELI